MGRELANTFRSGYKAFMYSKAYRERERKLTDDIYPHRFQRATLSMSDNANVTYFVSRRRQVISSVERTVMVLTVRLISTIARLKQDLLLILIFVINSL